MVIGTYSSNLHFTNNQKLSVPNDAFEEWLFLAFFDKNGEFFSGFTISENKFWIASLKLSKLQQQAAGPFFLRFISNSKIKI